MFHCSEDSTEEDLKLFLHRAYAFRLVCNFTIFAQKKTFLDLDSYFLHLMLCMCYSSEASKRLEHLPGN